MAAVSDLKTWLVGCNKDPVGKATVSSHFDALGAVPRLLAFVGENLDDRWYVANSLYMLCHVYFEFDPIGGAGVLRPADVGTLKQGDWVGPLSIHQAMRQAMHLPPRPLAQD